MLIDEKPVTLEELNAARRKLAALGRRIDRELNPIILAGLYAQEHALAADIDTLTDAYYGGGAHELD